MRWMSARRPRALNSAAMWRAGIRRASARPPNKFDPGPGSKKRDETRFAAPWPRRPPGCCQPRSENHAAGRQALPHPADGAGQLEHHGAAPAGGLRCPEPGHGIGQHRLDRKSVVEGKRVSLRVDLGGRRIIKKKKK